MPISADAQFEQGVDAQRMPARRDEPRQQQAAQAHAAHERAQQHAEGDGGRADDQLRAAGTRRSRRSAPRSRCRRRAEQQRQKSRVRQPAGGHRLRRRTFVQRFRDFHGHIVLVALQSHRLLVIRDSDSGYDTGSRRSRTQEMANREPLRCRGKANRGAGRSAFVGLQSRLFERVVQARGIRRTLTNSNSRVGLVLGHRRPPCRCRAGTPAASGGASGRPRGTCRCCRCDGRRCRGDHSIRSRRYLVADALERDGLPGQDQQGDDGQAESRQGRSSPRFASTVPQGHASWGCARPPLVSGYRYAAQHRATKPRLKI